MQIDFTLQGKGGVGKSLIASLQAQYYIIRGLGPVCVDTDPVNATFAGYNAFDVQALDIMEGDDINPRAFDRLVELLMEQGESGRQVAVVDNGASTFVPLCSYMLQSGVVPLLTEAGHSVRFHTVITGGQAFLDTLQGFVSLAKCFPDVPLVVWINEYFGKAESQGKAFEETKAFQDHRNRVHSLVTIPSVKPETFGHDMNKMITRHLTFAEADASPDFGLMERQRLRMMWRNLQSQMARAQL
jgi:hypothetical protein